MQIEREGGNNLAAVKGDAFLMQERKRLLEQRGGPLTPQGGLGLHSESNTPNRRLSFPGGADANVANAAASAAAAEVQRQQELEAQQKNDKQRQADERRRQLQQFQVSYPTRVEAQQTQYLEAIAKEANEHIKNSNKTEHQSRYGQLVSFLVHKLSQGELEEVRKKFNANGSVWQGHVLSFFPQLVGHAVPLGDSVNRNDISDGSEAIQKQIDLLKEGISKTDSEMAVWNSMEKSLEQEIAQEEHRLASARFGVNSGLGMGNGGGVPSSAGFGQQPVPQVQPLSAFAGAAASSSSSSAPVLPGAGVPGVPPAPVLSPLAAAPAGLGYDPRMGRSSNMGHINNDLRMIQQNHDHRVAQ